MSRHRNIRSMNYDEEYDDYYEEMASSYDEPEFGVSPTTAKQYLYNPNDPKMDHRIRTLSISEENEEDILKESQNDYNYETPKLDSQTYACMEKIQDVIGNAFEDNDIIRAIHACNYDSEKAINLLLNREALPSSRNTAQNKSKNSQIFSSSGTPSGFISFFEPPKVPFPLVSKNIFITNELPAFSSARSSGSGSVAVNKGATQKTAPAQVLPSVKAAKTIKSNSNLGTTGISQDSQSTVRKSVPGHLQADIPGQTPETSPITTPRLSTKSFPTIKQKSPEEITALYDKFLKNNPKVKINLVIVGHVDAGKSTIMGHLLYLKGSVSQKLIHRNEVDSKKVGKASFMFAWVLDQTEEERSRGVTIDVGQHHFETDNRFVTILDAPGHRDFIPNMIVGATKADVAILVVDATKGEFETGFESGGQTQEHTLLLRSLGISQLAVVVNKIDNADYSEERFTNIQEKLTKFLKQVGFKESSLHFIPCSGLTGDNLVQKSDKPQFAWFKGKTLIQVIDEFTPNERPVTQPFRMAVKDIFKGPTSGICVAGKIDSGFVENNQKLFVKPSNEIVSVKSIFTDEKCVENAFAGDVLTLNLNIDDSFELLPGCVLTDISTLQNPIIKFEARVVIYNNITRPVMLGFPVMLYSVCVNDVAKISKIQSLLNKKNEIIKKNPRFLSKNDMAFVEFTMQRPVWLELYQDFKEYGRFVFRSGDVTVGAGVVTKILA